MFDGTGFGKKVTIFGADIISCMHINNKKKDILIFGENPTQELGDTILTAEKEYSMNLTEQQNKFCSNLHYKGKNSYIFVNGIEIYELKAKDFEINSAPLICSGL